MRILNADSFIEMLEQKSIGFDKRYSPPYCLTYLNRSMEEVSLCLDDIEYDVINFLDELVMQIGPWNSGWLWKRIPVWNYESSAENESKNYIWKILIHEGFIPVDYSGAIEFKETEKKQLVRILFAQLMLGLSVYDDVCFIPDHMSVILSCDHHKMIRLDFKDTQEKVKFMQTKIGERFGEG